MKNLSESGFQDLIDTTKKEKSDSLLLGNKNRKKKKDRTINIQQQDRPYQNQLKKTVDIDSVVIPPSLDDMMHQQVIDDIQQQKVETTKEEKKQVAEKTIKKAGRRKKIVQEITQQKIIDAQQKGLPVDKQKIQETVENQVQTQQITPNEYIDTKEVLEESNNVSLDGVNVPEVIENVGVALDEIPDGANVDIEDIEIIPSKIKKDKSGYFKTKVNIKKDNIPDIINKIASYVKQHSKGIIKPRVCDLRVIGNTNKTQLRNSNLKLSTSTVVFKPDHTKLKVNKGTRFMISIPDDFVSTNNLLIYLQESRAKTILEVTGKDFPSLDVFIEFIGDRIAEYYYFGYDVTLRKLQLRGKDNALMNVISTVLSTKDYKAKPYVDGDNHLFAVDFISKGADNQWLTIQIKESDTDMGGYSVVGLNTLSGDEYNLYNKNVTIKWLEDNMITLLNKSYSRDWSKELAETGLEEEYYILHKLSHYKLREACLEIFNFAEENPNNGIIIQKSASKRDMIKLQKTDYDAESIIGKSNKLDFFVLTYLAYQIIGGDKRTGREYITRQQYYNNYDVKDRRNYQERGKTILKKEGVERNYNARPYVFQLEYSVNGKKNIYRARTFKEVVNDTKFLTNNPDVSVNTKIE